MSSQLEFPCLSLDAKKWFSNNNSSEEDSRSEVSDSEVLVQALKNFLLDPLMLEEEEPVNTNPWLLSSATTSTTNSSANSSGSSTPTFNKLTVATNNNKMNSCIMAPVLKETPKDFWLANNNNDYNNKNNMEEQLERAPVTDRVPNPSTSLWLAASTASISSQTAANNITWPNGSLLNNNKPSSTWLQGETSEVKPTANWLLNWTKANQSTNWLKTGSDWSNAPAGSSSYWLAQVDTAVKAAISSTSDWLDTSMTSSTESIDWLKQAQSAKVGRNNPLADWPHKDTTSDNWLLANEESVIPETVTMQPRANSPAVEMWLNSALEEEEEDFDDSESSIVVLSEGGSSAMQDVEMPGQEDEDDLGFWLI